MTEVISTTGRVGMILHSQWHRPFWRGILIAFVAVLLTHIIADRFDSENANKVIYVTRMLMYLLLFLALAALAIRAKWTIVGQLLVLVCLLDATELVFYGLRGWPALEHHNYTVPDFPPDHVGAHLGDVPWGDSTHCHIKTFDGDTLFNVRYTIDHFNRRFTPGHDPRKTGHALFFGCSVCFGWGVQDDETLPYQVQQCTHDLNAYNYSYSGWSASQMLARLQYQDLSAQVMGDHGVGVYLFIWSHIRRVIGDYSSYTGWGFEAPYYRLEGDSLVRDGNFTDDRWWLSWAYRTLNNLNTFRYFAAEIPVNVSEEDARLTVEVIRHARDLYEKQFPNDTFHVVIYSDWQETVPEAVRTAFVRMLDERKIHHVDMSGKVPMDDAHLYPHDGHPRPVMNREMAPFVVQALGLK